MGFNSGFEGLNNSFSEYARYVLKKDLFTEQALPLQRKEKFRSCETDCIIDRNVDSCRLLHGDIHFPAMTAT